jgi:hypothetical protein
LHTYRDEWKSIRKPVKYAEADPLNSNFVDGNRSIGLLEAVMMASDDYIPHMPGITEDDLKRIVKFNRTLYLRRTPDLLCPDEENTNQQTIEDTENDAK